jgi:exodeoxyribonuclease V alpha subunit
MRQGPLGVDAVNGYFLNQYIQTISHGTWWVAPLMITRNDPELQLFNGDLGFVVRKVGPGFSLRQFHLEDYALFPESANGFKQISALALNAFEYSYCLSVHKSQGSEYDETFILVPEGSELFGREVLYTAITRARHKVCLAGSQLTLSRLISLSSRKTSGISYRLK